MPVECEPRRPTGVPKNRVRALDMLTKRGKASGDVGDFSGTKMTILAQCDLYDHGRKVTYFVSTLLSAGKRDSRLGTIDKAT